MGLHKTRGFNLIELMVVVAILAIIAVIAIPSYRNYLYRSRVAEGLVLADSVKIAVSEFMMQNNAVPSSNSAVGLPESGVSPSNGQSNVSNISVSTDGQVTVTFVPGAVPNALKSGASATLVLVPQLGSAVTDPITWTCVSPDIAQSVLPSICSSSVS